MGMNSKIKIDNWNHPDRIREPIKVGDVVMLYMVDYFPMEVKIIREPIEGDELWYVEVWIENIEPRGMLQGSIQAINPRSSQFVRFVKATKDEFSE